MVETRRRPWKKNDLRTHIEQVVRLLSPHTPIFPPAPWTPPLAIHAPHLGKHVIFYGLMNFKRDLSLMYSKRSQFTRFTHVFRMISSAPPRRGVRFLIRIFLLINANVARVRIYARHINECLSFGVVCIYALPSICMERLEKLKELYFSIRKSTYIYMYLDVRLYVYVYIHMHVCLYVCMYVCTRMYYIHFSISKIFRCRLHNDGNTFQRENLYTDKITPDPSSLNLKWSVTSRFWFPVGEEISKSNYRRSLNAKIA